MFRHLRSAAGWIRCSQVSSMVYGRIRSLHGNSSNEITALLATRSTQALVDALWVQGYPPAMIEGSRPLKSGAKCAGKAVTLRFVPHRPDIAASKPTGEESPEYAAFELCGPNEVLVMSSVGPWESVGGDIKFLRLMQREVGGLVTDGSVRDTKALQEYGFPVFSYSTTAHQGPAAMQPWAVNDVVSVGGVSVCPGDYIIGDQDGVVVVPQELGQETYQIAHQREEVEDVIKGELIANPCSPGKFYPFRAPVNRSSPLGQLLTKRGITHQFAGEKRALHSSVSSAASSSIVTGSDIPSEMTAVVVNKTGAADTLKASTVATPSSLSDGEVLVKNSFAGVNFIDTYHRSGLYVREKPFILGQEASGVIAQTTPAAEKAGFSEGTPVAYSVLGTYCEFTRVESDKLLKVPESFDLGTACAVPVQGLTAHYLVHDAHLGAAKPGDWMLIHAAAGGTGQFAVQLAKLAGFQVIGTCSSGKVDICQDLGCDAVIDYGSENVSARVMEITGGAGVSVVLDGVGKSTYEGSLASLGVRGVCVFFGNASGPVPPIAPLELVAKSTFITRPKLNDYTLTRAELDRRARDVFSASAAGHLDIKIDRHFPITQPREAHEYIEAGRTTGKLLIDL